MPSYCRMARWGAAQDQLATTLRKVQTATKWGDLWRTRQKFCALWEPGPTQPHDLLAKIAVAVTVQGTRVPAPERTLSRGWQATRGKVQ